MRKEEDEEAGAEFSGILACRRGGIGAMLGNFHSELIGVTYLNAVHNILWLPKVF